MLRLCIWTCMGSYPIFSQECFSLSDVILFFEVTILPKFGKVSRLSLKLYLKVKIANFKNTRRSFPINISNWIPDITQFPAMLVGNSGEIVVNYLPHAVYCITSSCEENRCQNLTTFDPIYMKSGNQIWSFHLILVFLDALSYSAEGKNRQ